jgi:uracil-DNA glycosylase
MTRNQQISELFSEDFKCKNFFERGRADMFTCPKQSQCRVDQKKEAIWSPGIGDEGTQVMIVAEAPSKKGGLGPHISGLIGAFSQAEAVNGLLRFAKKYFNTVPYFTDLMKCGVREQTKQAKHVFRDRTLNCVEHFLLKEIEIIKPHTILCVGASSFAAIKQCKETGQINKDIEIIKLIHYGRQANLPLTKEDKENIIWPLQLRKISAEKIFELDFIKRNAS